MELPIKNKKVLEEIQKYDSKFKMNKNNYTHYFAPDIPDKVMKELLKNFDSNLEINNVVAFYDTSFNSSSKAGYLFMRDGFYYKYMGDKMYFAYKDISHIKYRDGKLDMDVQNADIRKYTFGKSFDMDVFGVLLIELTKIDEYYGQTSYKSSGKVKTIVLPSDMKKKCNAVIHPFAIAAGGAGSGLAQIPGSDCFVIAPIQIGMIVGLGEIFDLHITESAAKSIIASAGASIAGRTVSQFLIGWIPIIGNVVNTVTAAGITEAIGWIAVKNFYERWMQDKNKGRFDGMKEGYAQASTEYESKIREQADEFIKQVKDVKKEREEYEKLLDEYEELIKELEIKLAAAEYIKEMKDEYEKLAELSK